MTLPQTVPSLPAAKLLRQYSVIDRGIQHYRYQHTENIALKRRRFRRCR